MYKKLTRLSVCCCRHIQKHKFKEMLHKDENARGHLQCGSLGCLSEPNKCSTLLYIEDLMIYKLNKLCITAKTFLFLFDFGLWH